MGRLFLTFITSIFLIGQNYNVNVYGISVANANLVMDSATVQLNYKTEGIANVIWPAKNAYSTWFDTTHFAFNKFTKKIKQGPLNQSITIKMEDGMLEYKKSSKKRAKSTHNLFSLMARLRRNSALDLDTKWLVFDHEGVLYNSRFLLAGQDTLSLNGRQIPCNHFRMDIRISTDESPFYDETDRLMRYAVNENTVRQIWVEQNGIRRIIQANIIANGFPFEIVIQND